MSDFISELSSRLEALETVVQQRRAEFNESVPTDIVSAQRGLVRSIQDLSDVTESMAELLTGPIADCAETTIREEVAREKQEKLREVQERLADARAGLQEAEQLDFPSPVRDLNRANVDYLSRREQELKTHLENPDEDPDVATRVALTRLVLQLGQLAVLLVDRQASSSVRGAVRRSLQTVTLLCQAAKAGAGIIDTTLFGIPGLLGLAAETLEKLFDVRVNTWADYRQGIEAAWRKLVAERVDPAYGELLEAIGQMRSAVAQWPQPGFGCERPS